MWITTRIQNPDYDPDSIRIPRIRKKLESEADRCVLDQKPIHYNVGMFASDYDH